MNPKYILIGAGLAALMFKDKITEWLSGEEQPAVAPPTGQQQQQTPPNVTPPANVPVTEALIKQAAWDPNTATILGSRVLLDTHQWNFYANEHGLNVASDLRMETGQDPAQKITAAQYQAKLRTAGYL